MPDVFERFFSRFGKRPDDFYDLKRLDPSYRIFFGPEDWVDISADLQKNVELFESIEPGAGKKLLEYWLRPTMTISSARSSMPLWRARPSRMQVRRSRS